MNDTAKSGTASNYKCCDHFQPALDPNILRAYHGYCKARAWPFTVMVPLGGFSDPCPKPPAPKTDTGKG